MKKYAMFYRAGLSKFFRLSAANRKEVLLAAVWLPLAHFRLKRRGLKSCLESLGVEEIGLAPWRAFAAADRYEQALECRRNVAAAARYGVVAGTCLSRSLTVLKLLANRGITGQLLIGVDLQDGTLEAHAWVEVEGVPLEEGVQSFRPFSNNDDIRFSTMSSANDCLHRGPG